MTKTNYLENKFLEHITGTAYTAPTLFVGLSSTAPAEDGSNITEPSSGGYARVSCSGKWGSVSAGSVSNNANIDFPESTGAWLAGASLPYFVLYDASSGGNALRYGTLGTARTVSAAGITLRFSSGQLTMTED